MTQLVPIELGEFCKVDSGFAFKSEQFSDDCNDVFLIKGSNLAHRQIKWDEGPWWNVDDYEKFKRYQLREQDVLLAMDRPIVGGQLKYSWIKEGDPKALLVQRVARLRAIEPEDQKFLRYVIASPAFLQYIDTITTGVNVPHISGPDIRKYKFNLPKKSARLKIAEVIDAYDDLIENNLKRIKLLEEMAQITFEQWFVRMKFPGHETAVFDEETGLPEGWKKSNLGNECELIMGQSPKSEFYNFEREGTAFHQGVKDYGFRFPTNTCWTTSGQRLARSGDILFSVRAPVGRLNIALEEIVLGRGLAAIRHKQNAQSFLFYQLQKIFFEEDLMGGGAIFASVTKNDMLRLELTIPSDDILKNFQKFASNCDASIVNLHNQISILKEARDILLPRLMTGMIDIEQMKLPDAMLQRLEAQEDKMATAI